MTQLGMNFGETVKVGCRVDGEIQHFIMENCYSYREARQAVVDGVPRATSVLALIVNKKLVEKPVDTPAEFSHTTSPDRA